MAVIADDFAMAVSDQELESLLDSVARIIDRYGEVYWPMFERLEAELERRASKSKRIRARLERATSQTGHGVSRKYPTEMDGRS